MKRFLTLILLLAAASPLAAQLLPSGRTALLPRELQGQDVPQHGGSAPWEVKTSEENADGQTHYKVEGIGRTLPTSGFFNLEDIYTVWIDTALAAPRALRERHPRGRLHLPKLLQLRLARLEHPHPLAQPQESLQRKADAPHAGEHGPHRAVLQPAFGHGRGFPRRRARHPANGPARHHPPPALPLSGAREQEDPQHGTLPDAEIRMPAGNHRGIFRSPTARSSRSGSPTTRNKIPLYIESPVKVGSINAYISGYKGLKYPVSSLMK